MGIEVLPQGTSWDVIDTKMFSTPVLMGWGAQTPLESYFLYHSSNMGVDYYNPENFCSEQVDFYLDLAMAQTDYDLSMSYFKEAQAEVASDMPWVWLVNLEHLYFVREGLDLGEQKIHPHGHAWPLVGNLAEWKWV